MSPGSMSRVDQAWFCKRPDYDSFFLGPESPGFEVFWNVGDEWDGGHDVETYALGTTITPPVLPRSAGAADGRRER